MEIATRHAPAPACKVIAGLKHGTRTRCLGVAEGKNPARASCISAAIAASSLVVGRRRLSKQRHIISRRAKPLATRTNENGEASRETPKQEPSEEVFEYVDMPEKFGFKVADGVKQKGTRIGLMEDGIRPLPGGGSDVVQVHSYSGGARRVDMARLKCGCPSPAKVCSHVYAALVAYPKYRRSAALLLMVDKVNKEVEEKAGAIDQAAEQIREGLPIMSPDELLDTALLCLLRYCSSDQGLGRSPPTSLAEGLPGKGRKSGAQSETDSPSYPSRKRIGWNQWRKIVTEWSEGAEGKLRAAGRNGTAAQQVFTRLQSVVAALRRAGLSSYKVSSLLLALCWGRRRGEEDEVWQNLAQSQFWDLVVPQQPIPEGQAEAAVGPSTSESKLKQVLDEVFAEAELQGKPVVERLCRAEQEVLQQFEVKSICELSIEREADKRQFSSFLELIQDLGEEGLLREGSGGAGNNEAMDPVSMEAATILAGLGGAASLGDASPAESFADILSRRFGMEGEGSAWKPLAEEVLSAESNDEVFGAGAFVSSYALAWESERLTAPQAPFRKILAERAEVEAARQIQLAPSLVELRSWLLWELLFEKKLGSLRSYLRREAKALGIIIIEVAGNGLIKVDLAAGSIEAFQEAAKNSDARRAAEAVLAYCHACGGAGSAELSKAFEPSMKAYVDSHSEEESASWIGDILGLLPVEFVRNSHIARFLLASTPASQTALQVLVKRAGRPSSELAAVACEGTLRSSVSIPAASALLRQVAERLETGSMDETDTLDKRRTGAARAPSANDSSSPLAKTMVSEETASSSTREEEEEEEEEEVVQDAARVASTSSQWGMNLPSASEAEALITNLRREEFGFGEEEPIAGTLQAKQNARLARALKKLAGELYGSDVHWQLELLQNSDDNKYEDGVVPTAVFELKPAEVLFRCNEVGFREADIRAICDIGNSSKVGKAKYADGGRVVATGEKGLGFKAVFAVTDTPTIFSGPYRLQFDAGHSSGIGYILPKWLAGEAWESAAEELLEGGWGSALKLPLRKDQLPHEADLFNRLAALPASTLLFLKKLQRIEIVDSASRANQSEPSRGIRMRRAAANDEARWEEGTCHTSIEVCRGESEEWEQERWFVTRRRYEVPEGVGKPGLASAPTSTLVELALPLTQDGAIDTSRGEQPVFAFLPVRSYGFTFALQADWAVSSSREELLGGSEWNNFLKEKLPQLVVQLLEEVKASSTPKALQRSFYSSIPASPLSVDPQFRSVVSQVQAALTKSSSILTDLGTYQAPRLCFRCSHEARDALGSAAADQAPLRAAMRSLGMYLVDEEVEALSPSGLLESLGVQRFGARQLLRILGKAAEAQPSLAEWRKALALLDELLSSMRRAEMERLVEDARTMPILPLEGGLWSSAAEGPCLPPAKQEVGGIPASLLSELRAVHSGLLEDDAAEGKEDLAAPRVQRLLKRLGVPALWPLPLREVLIRLNLFEERSCPNWVRAASLEKPVDLYLEVAGFIAMNKELAADLQTPVGWPLEGLKEVAVGIATIAPAMHSPSAASFLKAIEGVPAVPARVPAMPDGWKPKALGEALEGMALALPGPLVYKVETDDVHDWHSLELEKLLERCRADAESGAGVQRSRLLAQCLTEAWSRYEPYSRSSTGSASSFMKSLQNTAWLPADEGNSDDSTEVLQRPCELCASTPAIRGVFEEASLAGHLTTAVEGSFAKALGVATEPTADLALSVLRGLGKKCPVGPEAAKRLYKYLQTEGADLKMLCAGDEAVVVVAKDEPAMPPSCVVWEDDQDLGACPVLAKLYGSQWRDFFVNGLGVPAAATTTQLLQRLETLRDAQGDGGSLEGLWPVLLCMAKKSQQADPERDILVAELKKQRCIPTTTGKWERPSEDVMFVDDCPQLPHDEIDGIKAQMVTAAEPPSGTMTAPRLWLKFLDSLGLRPLSKVCSVEIVPGGRPEADETLQQKVEAILPLAQEYLYQNHRDVHDATSAQVARLVRQLCVRSTHILQLCCRWPRPESDGFNDKLINVAAALQVAKEECVLFVQKDAPLPEAFAELAQLCCPAASDCGDDEAVRSAREALRSFLVAAASAVAAEQSLKSIRKMFRIRQRVPKASLWKSRPEEQKVAVMEEGQEESGADRSAAPSKGTDAVEALRTEAGRKAQRARLYNLKEISAVRPKMQTPELLSMNSLTKGDKMKIGRWGEELVYEFLKKELYEGYGGEQPDKRVIWVNEKEESGFPYDIRIEDVKRGTVIEYVEVKSTAARNKANFEMSFKEWEFASRKKGSFVIMRVENACRDDVEPRVIRIGNPLRKWEEKNIKLYIEM